MGHAPKAQTGGGSNPEESFESLGLRFSGRSGQALKERFAGAVPILGYIQGNAFMSMFGRFPKTSGTAEGYR